MQPNQPNNSPDQNPQPSQPIADKTNSANDGASNDVQNPLKPEQTPSQNTASASTPPQQVNPANTAVTPVSKLASQDDKSKKWYKNGIISYVIVVVSAICLALIINTFILQSYVVVGTSMTPTLQNNNRLIVDKTPVTWHKVFGGEYVPKRGNIIIFKAPIKITENGVPADQLIKRVIGLPGDHVVVKNGKITIYNNQHPKGFNPDNASYGKDLAPTAGNVDLTVPEGFIFVCGDNRVPGGSFDSRTELGPIPIKNIVGHLTARYMPLNEVQGF